MANELEGARELTQQLRRLGRLEGGKPLVDAARAGIRIALRQARANAPMGTEVHVTYKGRRVFPGFLRRSVHSVVKGDSQGATALLGMRRQAFYGGFLELGTSKMAKRPWLVPAFESTRSEQLAAIVKSLRRSVAKAIRANKL